MKYKDELTRSMTFLGQKEDTYFIGQSCSSAGTSMFDTLKDVPMEKRLELPVFEETQLGMSTGMALNGTKVISIFPRWDFLICGASQLVNHLNRLKEYSNGEYQPSVTIRTAVGADRPLNPQSQHRNNYSEAFRLMCDNIEIIELHEPEDIFPAYEKAYNRTDGKSTILVEFGNFYSEK